MQSIYSKQQPDQLLHKVCRWSDFNQGRHADFRENVSAKTESLQLGMIVGQQGRHFPAHYHLPLERHIEGTQECWVVIVGRVEVRYYDTDHEFLGSVTLFPGDCFISYSGGHEYTVLDNDTFVYEFKTGPYVGKEKDKEFIG